MLQGFHVYGAALGLVKALGPLLDEVRSGDRDLADQLRRASASVVLNIAEGSGRRGRDRVHFFRIALGSAREVQAALDVALAWGIVRPSQEADDFLDRVCAMLWKSTRGPGQ